MTTNPLTGKFFLSFSREIGKKEVRWQGQVLSPIENGYYLVQLYDWVLGEPNAVRVVNISQMVGERWTFFDTDEAMRKEYKIKYS